MKNQIVKSFVVVTLITLASIVSANAQTNGRVTATVSFDFSVGDQRFAAGEYIIEKATPQSNNTSLIIRKKDGKSSRIVMMLPLDVKAKNGDTQASLFFNRYGSDYFLSEVVNTNDHFGAKMPKTKEEANLARQFGTPTRETVALNSVKH